MITKKRHKKINHNNENTTLEIKVNHNNKKTLKIIRGNINEKNDIKNKSKS